MIDTDTGDLVNKDSLNTQMAEMTCEGRECPNYAKGNCREIMNLQFMLPKISGLGVWQIDTSSINSIRNINSCIELIRAVYGRVRMVPLFLSIEPIEVTPPNVKKKTVHVLNLRSMDSMIQAAINARKTPLELVVGAVGVEQAQKDVDEAWPLDEQERMLSPDEAAERMTPEEIEGAAVEDKVAEEVIAEMEAEPVPESEKGEPEHIQEEADYDPSKLNFDAVWLEDSLKEIGWVKGSKDTTIRSYLKNVLGGADDEGKSIVAMVALLSDKEKEKLFKYIQDGLDKKQSRLI